MDIKLSTKPNMLLLILSVLLFIMVFLPWWTVSAFGFSASENGFHNGGILTFIMALAGIGLSFLEIPTPRYKSYAIIGVGILALLGVLIAFKDLGGGIGMGVGMILALILSIVLIAVGFLDYRRIDVLANIKASQTESTPPPPTQPSQPVQPSQFVQPGQPSQPSTSIPMKHIEPIMVIILSIITFGIYSLIWYVSTKNQMNANGAQIPTAWLLIVPIVNLFWLWKFSEGVELVTRRKMEAGVAFCLIFLTGVIGMAIVQDRLNKVSTQSPTHPSTPPTPPPTPPSTPPTTPPPSPPPSSPPVPPAQQ